MHWNIILFLTLLASCCTQADVFCNNHYKFLHDSNNETSVEQLNATQPSICNIDNIPDSVGYNLLLCKDGLPTGVLQINITWPKVNCNLEIALLVNDTIKSKEECEKYDFDDYSDKEIHSVRKICISEYDNSTDDQIEPENLLEDEITLLFHHIFTGCYALRYTIDYVNYVIRSNEYIPTSYQRREVENPLISACNYRKTDVDSESRALVTFNFDISVTSGPMSVTLKLMRFCLEDDRREKTCGYYEKKLLCAQQISLGDQCYQPAAQDCISYISGSCNDKESELCTLTVSGANSTSVQKIDYSFSLPVPFDETYGFILIINDWRCSRHTAWNPPPNNLSFDPCAWISNCTKIDGDAGVIIKIEDKQGPLDHLSSLLPVAAGMIILVVIISGTVFYIYRSRSRVIRQELYLNTTLRELKDANNIDTDHIDTDDDSDNKIGRYDRGRAIVLLYARGSKPFMAFMLHFREILECYCGCHVYDWYAPCEWDAVAKIGPCEWADTLIRRNNRIVWIDTPTARSLINIHHMSNKSLNNEHPNPDVINDFRDSAFPAVLEFAKRTITNPKLQYDKHFVVRLEGLHPENLSDDPFLNLSPHTRFLIPYHLKQLCSLLSSKKSEAKNEALTAEEAQLKERLKKIKHQSL